MLPDGPASVHCIITPQRCDAEKKAGVISFFFSVLLAFVRRIQSAGTLFICSTFQSERNSAIDLCHLPCHLHAPPPRAKHRLHNALVLIKNDIFCADLRAPIAHTMEAHAFAVYLFIRMRVCASVYARCARACCWCVYARVSVRKQSIRVCPTCRTNACHIGEA